MRANFLGCPVDLFTSKDLLSELKSDIDEKRGPKIIQFVNANKIAQVRENPALAPVMWRASYVLTDGQPLVPMGRLLGIRIPERIDGIGLMKKLLVLASQHGYSVYLLGAKQEVLEVCVHAIKTEFPQIKIAGYRNGYFKPDETDEVVRQIRESKAHVLFLGFGSPMKENFADKYARELGVPLIQGVGGSFDVTAGVVKRAPVWIQRIGFEWAYRIAQEPRRMFWRYVKTNTRCLMAFAEAFFLRRNVQRQPIPANR
jgi:N-acetylglucosaminyldiphosphoundecaprenol N-acetyl-beta-D-mannosaminyltransferase